MRVRDVMRAPAITMAPDLTIKEAIETLTNHRINGAPVVDPAGRLVGMITEADLLPIEVTQEPQHRQWIGGSTSRPRHVSDVMIKDVTSVPPDVELPLLARIMVEQHLKTIPVVEGGIVTGVVTRRDVLALFVRSDEEIRREVQGLLEEEAVTVGSLRPVVKEGVVYLIGRSDRDAAKVARRLVLGIHGVVDVNLAGIDLTGQRRPLPRRARDVAISRR